VREASRGDSKNRKDNYWIRHERGYVSSADPTFWKDYLVELLTRPGH
jgi:hypothetical protein